SCKSRILVMRRPADHRVDAINPPTPICPNSVGVQPAIESVLPNSVAAPTIATGTLNEISFSDSIYSNPSPANLRTHARARRIHCMSIRYSSLRRRRGRQKLLRNIGLFRAQVPRADTFRFQL